MCSTLINQTPSLVHTYYGGGGVTITSGWGRVPPELQESWGVLPGPGRATVGRRAGDLARQRRASERASGDMTAGHRGTFGKAEDGQTPNPQSEMPPTTNRGLMDLGSTGRKIPNVCQRQELELAGAGLAGSRAKVLLAQDVALPW